jgi:hypothetical protein
MAKAKRKLVAWSKEDVKNLRAFLHRPRNRSAPYVIPSSSLLGCVVSCCGNAGTAGEL